MQEISNVESRSTRSSRFRLPEPTRAWRRRAVLAAYGGYALTVAIFWIGYAADFGPKFRALGFVPGIVYLVGFFALCSRSLGAWSIANDSDNALDERQQRVRDRAYRPSYWVVSLILLLGAAYVQLADSSGWWLPSSTEAFQGITWTLIFLTMTLPTAIIAWTEPDAPAE
jgi:hypothetical protein